MAATAKQLAALKKARAARKKNLTKKAKPVKRKTATKKAVKKAAPKRKKNPASKAGSIYIIEITANDGKKGYVKTFRNNSFSFDTIMKNAVIFSDKSIADLVGKAVKSNHSKQLKGVSVKKLNGVYRKNPVSPSSRASKVAQASELFEQFTGHDADYVDKINVDISDTYANIGYVDGIMYETVRDGEKEHYIHKFKKSTRPTFGASHDGASLALIGGNFTFTERGIVDN